MMRCSICGKPIYNNIAIHLKNRSIIPIMSPSSTYICKDCLTEMLKTVNNLEKEVEDQENKLEAFIDTLDGLKSLYCDLLLSSEFFAENDTTEIPIQLAINYCINFINSLTSYEQFKDIRELEYNNCSIIDVVADILRNSIISMYNALDFKYANKSNFRDLLDTEYIEYVNEFKEAASQIELDPEQQETKKTDKNPIHIDTPREIKNELDKYIIGQENAKKDVAVGIYNHYIRCNYNLYEHTNDDVEIQKSNILFIGPTGCGKTEMARTIAKKLNVPFVIINATSYTAAGFVGDDVENILYKLIQAADGDIERAQRGIVYIDEIDKLARSKDSQGKDVNGEEVQQALLKIIEDGDVEVTLGNNRNPMSEKVTINTSNILFICGGAFEGLTMVETVEKTGMGFNSEVTIENDNSKITPEMLTKDFGLIPEFVGRVPVIVRFDMLTEDDLADILTVPKNSIISQYKVLMGMSNGTKVTFTKKALKWVAHKAYENKTGARGLKSIIETNMRDLMYDLPDEKDVDKVKIDIKNDKLCISKHTVNG